MTRYIIDRENAKGERLAPKVVPKDKTPQDFLTRTGYKEKNGCWTNKEGFTARICVQGRSGGNGFIPGHRS